MAGYVVADVRVTDEAGFAEFAAGVPASIEGHGGKYIIRGGDPELRQGDWAPPRFVVVEFDSADAARAWLDSDGVIVKSWGRGIRRRTLRGADCPPVTGHR